jgi:hypothetical protein
MKNCYSLIESELAKGARTEAKLVEKCEADGFAARGARVALTRGANEGRFRVEEKADGSRTFYV